MGEIVVTDDKEVILTALGLGSCIGLFVYDYRTTAAGCAHVVLPHGIGMFDTSLPAKSMDNAFVNLIEAMQMLTNSNRAFSWALLGGAQLFSGLSYNSVMNIGSRNIAAAQLQMAKHNIKPVYTDFGGNKGRTAKLAVQDGVLCMRRLGMIEQPIADLRLNRVITEVVK